MTLLFWIYLFLQFLIFVYVVNRVSFHPRPIIPEHLWVYAWTFVIFSVQTVLTAGLALHWDFQVPTFGPVPIFWKLVFTATMVGTLWILADHAWWILFRKKPVDYRMTRERYPNRPPRWPVPFYSLRRIGFPNQIYDLRVAEYQVMLPGWPKEFDGLTVVQLSDLHIGKYIHKDYLGMVVSEAKKLKPDLFALTGDFISFKKDIPVMGGILKGFKAPLGVYALLGNHDHWADGKAMRKALEHDGIRVLQNEVVYLKRKGKKLALLGVDDKWVGEKNDEPLLKAVGDAKILLAHQPDHLYLAHQTAAHLQLSGHCHGGQVCFPLIGPLVVPSNEGRKYAGGFHREKNTVIYIHHGIGCYPPLRTYCPPEVVKFTLKSA